MKLSFSVRAQTVRVGTCFCARVGAHLCLCGLHGNTGGDLNVWISAVCLAGMCNIHVNEELYLQAALFVPGGLSLQLYIYQIKILDEVVSKQ